MSDTEKGLQEQPVEGVADSPSSSGKRRGLKILIVVGVLASLALIIGLSVGLTRDNNSNQSGGPPETPTSLKFNSPTGRAFAVTLNLLTPSVLQGYNGDTEALRDDLTQAVQMYVSNSIEDQIRWSGEYGGFPEDDNENFGLDALGGDNTAGDVAGETKVGDTTDFETNNQEEGVDEADKVKSDGTYIYAAYDDTLVVWDAISGAAITNYTLPTPQQPDKGVSEVDIGAKDSMFYGDMGASISGISLHSSGRLVLYVSGYGGEVMEQTAKSSCSGLATRIIVLDTSPLPGDLVVVTQEDILGNYRDARLIGENVHVVTNCDFKFWTLEESFGRWNFPGLNDTEYRTAAVAAVEPNIADFVDLMVSDITTHGFPNMPQISLWQSSLGGNEAAVEEAFKQGPISSFTSLISFKVADLEEGELELSNAGACTPSSWGFTYAVEGMLVYAAQGWDWNSEKQATIQTTYLMGYSLDGFIAQPALLGSFPGYMQSQYALSIYEGHLRVATTIESFFPGDWEVMIPVESDGGAGDQTEDDPVLPVDPEGDGTVSSQQVDEPVDPDDVFDEPSVPWPQPQFETQNQVIILKIPVNEGDELTQVASIEGLGEEGETLQAVRYFGDIGYAVTYRQTDPFYVLSLDPNDAKVLGELKITGFSSYLHSMNEDDTLLVGLGEEAYPNGTILGLQLTIYDATNVSTPVDIHRKTIEDELGVYSSSEARSDYKAFRYLSLGDEVGIVIIPVTIQSSDQGPKGNFDGFYVYDVSRSGINLRMKISHVESQDYHGCYSNSQLPQRSLVFNGDVTTLKGHSVLSTNLDSGLQQWNFTLPNSNPNICYFW